MKTSGRISETPIRSNEARANVENIPLRSNDTWETAARRLVPFYRAATIEAERPHLSGAEYFWRHITVRQLQEILARIVWKIALIKYA